MTETYYLTIKWHLHFNGISICKEKLINKCVPNLRSINMFYAIFPFFVFEIIEKKMLVLKANLLFHKRKSLNGIISLVFWRPINWYFRIMQRILSFSTILFLPVIVLWIVSYSGLMAVNTSIFVFFHTINV